jgi:hypothetical protein
MRCHEFRKGGVALISATGTPAGEINATFSLVLCDLRDLSEAGVKHFSVWKKFLLRPIGRKGSARYSP